MSDNPKDSTAEFEQTSRKKAAWKTMDGPESREPRRARNEAATE